MYAFGKISARVNKSEIAKYFFLCVPYLVAILLLLSRMFKQFIYLLIFIFIYLHCPSHGIVYIQELICTALRWTLCNQALKPPF